MFEPPEFDPTSKAKLIAITFDETSIRRGSSNIEHEREVAVFDILEGNRFALDGRDGGPYTLNLSIVEDRLVFAVAQEGSADTFTVVLSLTPLRRIMKDYFVVCETYYQAIRTAPPSRIQSIDMGRRALHDDGSRVLVSASRARSPSTATRRGGCSRSSARCTGRDEGWAAGEHHGLPGAVLFVCTMNSVRSPMAAAILRHLVGRRVYVESAGVRAGGPDAFAAAVMEEIGIDITRHTPQTLRELYDTSFDLIVSLSPEAHHQALELTRTMAVEVEYWPTFDATMMIGQASREQILAAYRAVRDQLFRRIKQRFALEGGPSV